MKETRPFDAAEFIETPEAEAELLSDAFGSGDPQYIAHALGIIARARGMTEIARQSGVSRMSLYRSLSSDGDPKLSTLLGVMNALGLHLTVKLPNEEAA